MPDELSAQAYAGQNEAGVTNTKAGYAGTGGDLPLDALPANETNADPGMMSADEASAILEEAGHDASFRTRDVLAEREEADPLADRNEANALAGDLEAGADAGSDAEAEAEAAAMLEGDSDPELPRRIRVDLSRLNPKDAVVLNHARNTGKSFAEAEAELFGTEGLPEGSEGHGQSVDGLGYDAAGNQPMVETSGGIQAEIEHLKAQRKAAARDYDTERQNELTERIEEARERLGDAAGRERVAARHHMAAVESSVARVAEVCPDAFVQGTPLYDAVVAECAGIARQNPAFFRQPDWPESIVLKHAARLGQARGEFPAGYGPGRRAPRAAARAMAAPAPGGRSMSGGRVTADGVRTRLAEAQRRGDFAAAEGIMRELERAGR